MELNKLQYNLLISHGYFESRQLYKQGNIKSH